MKKVITHFVSLLIDSVKNEPPALHINVKATQLQQITETHHKCNNIVPFTASFIIHSVRAAVFIDSIIGKMHEHIASVGVSRFLVSACGKPYSKERNMTHSYTIIH
jgi:hypothetical protein